MFAALVRWTVILVVASGPAAALESKCAHIVLPAILCDGTPRPQNIELPDWAPKEVQIVSADVFFHVGHYYPPVQFGGLFGVFKQAGGKGKTSVVPEPERQGILMTHYSKVSDRRYHNPPIVVRPEDRIWAQYGCKLRAVNPLNPRWPAPTSLMAEINICWQE